MYSFNIITGRSSRDVATNKIHLFVSSLRLDKLILSCFKEFPDKSGPNP